MKKFLLFLALMVSGAAAAQAACSGSAPTLTAPTWADVAACHTAATNGSTITVSAGSYTVTATTTITKFVKIIASGTVTLTDNTADVGDLINITESTAGHTRLEGFAFVAGTGNHVNPNGVIVVQYASGGFGVLVTNNTYDNTSASIGDFIIWGSSYRGVIWDNTMTSGVDGGCANTAAFVRVGNDGLTSVWTEQAYYGDDDTDGDKNLYIEGNTLTNLGQGIDAFANARVVIRNNTITNSMIENHGADSGIGISARSIEMYDNIFMSDQSVLGCGFPFAMDRVIWLRGGPALIHDNVIPPHSSMAWTVVELQFTDLKLRRNSGVYPCWNDGYPSPYQVGWGYSTGGTEAGSSGVFQDLEPVYVWDNSGGGNYGAPSVPDLEAECGGGAPSVATYIVENRDYYLSTEKPNYTEYPYPHFLTYADTFYVNKSGSDANACATAQSAVDADAKLTVAAGAACLSGSDILMIGDGTYAEALRNVVPSGSSGAPTIIKAENRNGAILRPSSGFYVIEVSVARSYITFDGLDADGISSLQAIYYLSADAGTVSYIRIINGTARNSQEDSGFGGIGIQCGAHANVSGHHHIEVSNMDISGMENDSGDGSGGYGIYITCHDSLFENNNLHNNQGYAVHQYTGGGSGIDDNIVRNNRMDGAGQETGLSTDAVGVILISAGDGNLYYNNLIYGAPVHGIFVYASSSNLGIYNNTIADNTGTCVVLNSAAGVASTTIQNNICFGNGSDSISNGGSGTTSDHNLFTDPDFVNAGAFNFHLEAGSAALPPCGTPIPSITTDFDDVDRPSPPSCGAYEVPSGSNPSLPLSEDFESYMAGDNICTQNGGDGWTQSWNCDTASATVETAPMGMTGLALRLNGTSTTVVNRLMNSHTGAFTIRFIMRLSITDPNSDGIGVNLYGGNGFYQTSTYFNSAGNIISDSQTLAAFSANTNYTIDVNFDTVNQSGKYRTRINEGTYSAWENCASSCASIAAFEIGSYSTNAHTFTLDDISQDPVVVPPNPGTPGTISPVLRLRLKIK